MPNKNVAIIEGHLGRDPELKHFDSGAVRCTCRVGTSWGKESKKETTWHTIVIWGGMAEDVAINCHKGDALMVQGRIRTYQGSNKAWYTEIVAYEDSVKYQKKESKFEPEDDE